MFNLKHIQSLRYLCAAMLFSASMVYPYGREQHTMISQAAWESLNLSGYNGLCLFLIGKLPSGTSFMDKIVECTPEPDNLPLTDAEVNNFSDYAKDHPALGNYCFSDLEQAAFQKFMSMENLEWLGQQANAENTKAFLGSIGNDLSEKERALRSATQHTYVQDPDHPPSAALAVLTIAPWAAQAEYNQALKYWTVNQEEALRRLGRCLHYVQDITVPHHCEIVGNYPDLALGLCNGDFETHSSQNEYEMNHVGKRFKWESLHFTKDGERMGVRISFKDDFYATDIKEVLHGVQTQMLLGKTNRFMIDCDGVKSYSRIQPPVVCTREKPCLCGAAVFFADYYYQYLPMHDCDRKKILIIPYGPTTCHYGYDDNLNYVSDHWVPEAVKNCAKIIAKFFKETEGVGRD